MFFWIISLTLVILVIVQYFYIVRLEKTKKRAEKQLKTSMWKQDELAQRFVNYLKPLDDQQDALLDLVDDIFSKAPYEQLLKHARRIRRMRQVTVPNSFD